MGEKLCSVPGCGLLARVKGQCRSHYNRVIQGRPLDTPWRHDKADNRPGCEVPGCGRPAHTRKMCKGHYARARKGQPLDAPWQNARPYQAVACKAPGCRRASHTAGFCNKHYERVRRHGDPSVYFPKKGICRYVSGGYVFVQDPSDGYKYHREHRVVMEAALGRKIRPEEDVHHRNGIRTDSRLENLELWSHSQPRGRRVEDKIAWCLEFLSKYGEITYKQTWQPPE
jgi:hypothetical protein